MSELKAFDIVVAEEYYSEGIVKYRRTVYDKSEADKEIAELEESHKMEVEQLLILNREQANAANRLRNSMEKAIRHHKYKRCLRVAKWCFTKSNYHFVLARHGEDTKENNRKSILYSKWHKHWLNIAKKFREE